MFPAHPSEGVGLVRRPVVAHHATYPDAALPKPGDSSVEKGHSALPSLVGQKLDVGQAARVVDADVSKFPAHSLHLVEARKATGDAVAYPLDPGELLDVDVNEISRVRPLIPIRRFRWLQ